MNALSTGLCAVVIQAVFAAITTNAATTNSISPGETAGGVVAIGGTNYYSFTGTSNETVFILLTRSSGSAFYPTLDLVGPNGILLTTALDTGGYNNLAFLDGYLLAQSGIFTILVRDDDGNDTFPYSLTFIKAPGSNPFDDGGAVQPGLTVTNHIALGDIDVYNFAGTSNETVSIFLVRNGAGALYPTLELIAPNGDHLITAYGTGGYQNLAYLDAYRLTQSGTFSILVRDDGGNEPFSYSLTLIKPFGYNVGKDGNVIQPGQTLADYITRTADIDVYSFAGTSNETVFLLVTSGSSQVYPTLELIGPNGDLLTTASGTGGYRNLAYVVQTLNQTGTFIILIRDDGGLDSFPYSLTLVKAAGPNLADDGGVLQPGQTVTNSIAVPGDVDVYTFAGTSNETVFVLLTRAGGTAFYPTLELIGPNGLPLATVLDTGGYQHLAYLDAYRLPQSGTFTILVRDDGGNDTFPYSLTFVKAGGPNPLDDGGVIQPGQTVTNSIAIPGDIDVYTFTGTSNEAVYILLTRASGSTVYPTLELVGPNGDLLATVLHTSGNLNLAYIDNYRLLQNGTFTILVRDDGGNEPFPYNLTLIKCPGHNLSDTGDGPEVLLPGETRSASIGIGDVDAFSFSGIAGDAVSIKLRKTGGSGQYLALFIYAPDCSLIGSSLLSVSASLRFPCINQTGNYTILCRDAAGIGTFTYDVTLVQNPGPPPSYDPANPFLAIVRCMTNTVVRWPTNASGFQMEYRTDAVSGTWSNISPPYSIFANYYYLTNQSADPMRYYRLRKP